MEPELIGVNSSGKTKQVKLVAAVEELAREVVLFQKSGKDGTKLDGLQNAWGSSENHVRRYLECTARREQGRVLHTLRILNE